MGQVGQILYVVKEDIHLKLLCKSNWIRFQMVTKESANTFIIIYLF